MPGFPRFALLVCGALLAGGAPARHSPNPQRAERRVEETLAWSRKSAAALEARADARSLASAAVLLMGATPASDDRNARALQFAARAADADPADHTVGWLKLRLCEQSAGCDVQEAAAAMRWLDPDNAAAWLSMLAQAQRDRDQQDVDRALSAMAQGRRLRYYSNPAAVMVLDALTAAALPAAPGQAAGDHARLELVTYWTSSLLSPPPKPLLDACREAAPSMPRHEVCLRIATLLQHADTVGAQLTGYALQRHLFAPDSAEARLAQEHHHALELRVQRAARFQTAFLPWFRNRIAAHRIDLMRSHEREEDCIEAVLAEHHVRM